MFGRLFILSAPSGTGKTTLSSRLQADGLARVSVSHTTRPPRPGEEDGRQYFFVGRDEFVRMQNDGLFLESAEVYGNLYGTSAEWVQEQLAAGNNVLLEIDCQGARQVKHAAPYAVSIFLRPPSIDALRQRLNRRGQDAPDVVARRLAAAKAEMENENEYDCVIINDNLETAVAQARQILSHPTHPLPPTPIDSKPTSTDSNPSNPSNPSHPHHPQK